MSKIIFMKYLPPVRPKMIPKLKMPRIYWNLTRDISNIPISVFMSKIIFIKYLPTAWPKLVPKLKVLRIYWNLAHWIFRICQSRFWCQKSFLSNRYNLLGPNWSQNWKWSGFIEIWHICYFQYPDLNFDVKKYFLANIYQLLCPTWYQREKCLEFVEIWSKIENWKKYLIKIIFDIKIKIGIFEISNVPNFNKFWAFSFDIKSRSA